VERYLTWLLNGALRDERWLAFIRERMHQQELPVIQLEGSDA